MKKLLSLLIIMMFLFLPISVSALESNKNKVITEFSWADGLRGIGRLLANLKNTMYNSVLPRLSTLETNVENLKNEVDQLKEQSITVSQAEVYNEKEVAYFGHFSGLVNSIRTMVGRISSNETRIAALEARIAALESKLAEVSGKEVVVNEPINNARVEEKNESIILEILEFVV